MTRTKIYALALALLLPFLFALNVVVGAVAIPLASVADILLGGDGGREAWRFIVMESRLPQALTATLSGGALAVGGLLLQTLFRNPLADTSIFGVSGGASLGAAVAMLALGGTMTLGSFSATGAIAVLFAAFVGAMAVMGIIILFSTIVRGEVMLLVVGIMVGYLSSSAISLLNYFATDEGVKSYLVWGMGSFSGVSMRQMPLFSAVLLAGIAAAIALAKPLNALLLGHRYAANLGVRVASVRRHLIFVTGLLTAVVTAFCGPVSFIGLAVPHIVRLITRTDDHRRLILATVATGAVIALACNLLCLAPGRGSLVPLGAVTPLFGAPVIIYIILRRDAR